MAAVAAQTTFDGASFAADPTQWPRIQPNPAMDAAAPSFAAVVAGNSSSFAAKVAAARPFVPAAPPSYASVIAGPRALQPRFPPILLPPRQAGTKEGKPAVSFSNDEIQASSKRFNCSLVAKFTYGKPPIAEIHRAFQTHWKTNGRVTISDVWDNRHVLVMLDSEEDITTALSCPLRKINQSMFRLFRWSSDYNPKKESTITTAWVRLPKLPLPLFDRAFIGVIVSSFAHFLDVDDRTKACLSLKCARACIEIDVNQTIPDKIWVNMGDADGFWQDIEIESKLAYCSKCRVHGHGVADCRKAKASMEHKGKTAPKSDYGPDMLFSVTNPQQDDKGDGKNVQKDDDTSKEEDASKLWESNPVEGVSDSSNQAMVVYEGALDVYDQQCIPEDSALVVHETTASEAREASLAISKDGSTPISECPPGMEVTKMEQLEEQLKGLFEKVKHFMAEEGVFEFPEVIDYSFMEKMNRAVDKLQGKESIPKEGSPISEGITKSIPDPENETSTISEWIPASNKKKKKGKASVRQSDRPRQSTEDPDFIYHSRGLYKP